MHYTSPTMVIFDEVRKRNKKLRIPNADWVESLGSPPPATFMSMNAKKLFGGGIVREGLIPPSRYYFYCGVN